MKLFYRQLLFLIILFLAVYGGAVYLTFFRANASADALLEKNAVWQATAIKAIVESQLPDSLNIEVVGNDSLKSALAESILAKLDNQERLKNLLLVALPGAETLLTVSGSKFDVQSSIGLNSFTEMLSHENNGVLKTDTATYIAVFQLQRQADVGLILELAPDQPVLNRMHTLTVHYYLLGFGGILMALLLAMLSARFLKLPFGHIEKVFDNIEQRKFSYRIRLNKNHQFYGLYEKINRGMNQLYQMDASLRASTGARNTALNEMRTFSRYLDIMAHEIKNPLHAMGINLDVLKTKIQQQKPKADTLKHARILEREIDHLQQVIQGFLTYARPGVPRKARVRLNQLVKEVCQMVRSEADKSKVKIETRLGRNLKDIKIDREQFKRSLHNIVVNAIHASREKEKIVIRTRSNKRQLQVSVKDNGEGIAREEVKKIFDLYYTTKKEGTGLGLPVTKRLIEANGGQINFHSKKGQGTTVTITLPSL
jgi:signal transduction histidine kinase